MQNKSTRRRVGRPRKNEQQEGSPSSREQILAAATVVFAERGFEGASLDLVAERAGYSMGAIYHHFSGKPDLLVDVVDYALRTHDFPSGTDGEPPKIIDWLNFPRVYLDPANTLLRRLAGEIFSAANRYPEMAAKLSAFAERVTVDIAASIDAAKTQGIVASTVDSEQTARMFMVNCVGLVHIETFYPAQMGNPAWAKFVLDSLGSLLGIKS